MRYTAIIPSRTLENLALCVPSLREHSTQLADVIVLWGGVGAPPDSIFIPNPFSLDVYGLYNYGVPLADTAWVLLANDDMYFPPDWDRGLTESLDPHAFYTVRLVESGWQTVNERNIERDFGRTVAAFDRSGFDAFARQSTHSITLGLGWYMPVLVHRETFTALGGYPTVPPFPNANDIIFFEKARANGVQFMQLDSLVYHFQCLSQRGES